MRTERRSSLLPSFFPFFLPLQPNFVYHTLPASPDTTHPFLLPFTPLSQIKTKNTKQVIEFYYVWKKSSHYSAWKKNFVDIV